MFERLRRARPVPRPGEDRSIVLYRAFLSYQRDSDGRLAEALQSALQSFGRPWYRPVTYRIYRDLTAMASTPDLWGAVEQALRASEYLILLTSPAATRPGGVRREVDFWCRVLQRPARSLLIVLTGGPLPRWDEETKSFAPGTSESLPPELLHIFEREPHFVDMRWARDVAEPEIELSLDDGRFRDHVAELAVPLLGKQRKEEVIGEEVRQRRILRGVVTGVIVALLALSALAGWKAIQAQRRLRDATSRRLAVQSILRSASEPDLALLLAAGAYRVKPTAEARDALLGALTERSQLRAILQGHKARVVSLVFTDRELVSADETGEVRRWELGPWEEPGRETAAPLKIPTDAGPGQIPLIPLVTLSPDGRTAVVIGTGGVESDLSAGMNGVPMYWDLLARRKVRSLAGPQGQVRTLLPAVFSPDGRRVYVMAIGNRLASWDLGRHFDLREVPVQGPGSPSCFAVSADGSRAAVGFLGGAVRLLDLETGTPIDPLLTGHESNLSRLGFSHGGALLASGDDRGVIRLWDGRTGAAKGEPLPGHSDPTARSYAEDRITGFLFSPDDQLLFSGSYDSTVRLWNLQWFGAARAPIFRGIPEYPNWITSIALSQDGKTLATGDLSGRILLWETEAPGPLGRVLGKHSNSIKVLRFSQDSRFLASGSVDRTVMLQDLKEPWVSQVLHPGPVEALAFTAGSSQLVSVSPGVDTGKSLRIERIPVQSRGVGQGDESGKGNWPRVMVAVQGGRALISAGDDGVWSWSLAHLRRQPLQIDSNRAIFTLAADEEGRWVAGAVTGMNQVQVWMREGEEFRRLPEIPVSGSVNALAFSPDARYLAIGQGTDIRLWDVAARRFRDPDFPRAHHNGVTALAFSADGSLLASGSSDQTVILWGLQTGQMIGRPLQGHSNFVQALAFSPDGRMLASGDQDGNLILWNLVVEDWLSLACRAAHRPVSPLEAALYFDGSSNDLPCIDHGTSPGRSWPYPPTAMAKEKDEKGIVQPGM